MNDWLLPEEAKAISDILIGVWRDAEANAHDEVVEKAKAALAFLDLPWVSLPAPAEPPRERSQYWSSWPPAEPPVQTDVGPCWCGAWMQTRETPHSPECLARRAAEPPERPET